MQIKQEIDSDAADFQDDDDDLAMQDDHDDFDNKIRVKQEFAAEDSDGSDYNGSDSGDLDQENPILKRNRARMTNRNTAMIIADQQQKKTVTVAKKQQQQKRPAEILASKDGTQVFIKTLLHALECK